MIGTDHQYMPFYRGQGVPVIADFIVDNDIGRSGDQVLHEKTRGQKSLSLSTGAYEVWDYYENLGGKSRYLHFQAAPIP